jgi:D-lactate dehydrogenase (cytochrome)
MALLDALNDLRGFLGPRLCTAVGDLSAHAQSETHMLSRAPDAVAYPRDTDEVAHIAAICARHKVPMVGWGAGTSLEGHALAIQGGVTIDFRDMSAVLAIYPEDMLAVVQPGITREALNLQLRDTGLFFPIDPGANASLGGMTATRASGTTAVRYGTMRDNVLGMEVVLAGGRVMRLGSSAPKSAAGYDLTALFVGSEGTLGLITEITLRLHGQPEAVSSATCAFPTIAAAVDCVDRIAGSGLRGRLQCLFGHQTARSAAVDGGISRLSGQCCRTGRTLWQHRARIPQPGVCLGQGAGRPLAPLADAP